MANENFFTQEYNKAKKNLQQNKAVFGSSNVTNSRFVPKQNLAVNQSGGMSVEPPAGQSNINMSVERPEVLANLKAPNMSVAPNMSMERPEVLASLRAPQAPVTPVQPAAKTPDELAREQLARESQQIQFQPADFSLGQNNVKAPVVPAAQPEQPTAATVQPPQPSAPTIQDQINALRQSILGNITPGSQEQMTQQQLDALRGESAQNIANLEGQGRGITLASVRGQQGAIARQANAEAQTLEQRLATQEANRRANLAAAQQQLGFLTEDQRLAQQEQQAEEQQLQALALQAAQRGATPEEIQGILGAGNFGAAIGQASPFLQQPDKMLSVEDAQKLGVPFGTTVAEAKSLGITPQDEQNLLGGLTEAQRKELSNIQNQVRQDPDIKGFIDIRDAYNRVQASANSMQPDGTLTAAGDLSLIFNYMKMLDPGSVVRESEFASAQNAAGVPERVRNLYNQVVAGNKLGPDQVQDFLARTEDLYAGKLKNHQDAVNFYTNQANTFGIPNELVLRDFVGGQSTTALGPLNQSYNSLDALFQAQPEYIPIVEQIASETGMTDQEILKWLEETSSGSGGSSGLFMNEMSNSVKGSSVGSLSEKFESGGDPGAIGYDSTGGYSYGTYQLAHNNADNFIKQSKYAREFKGIPFNSDNFRSKWREIAQRDPEGFKQAQKDFIAKTHYQPQLEKIKRETGLRVDKLSDVMQDVIWSTAVQHGSNTDIVVRALKQLGRSATEEQLINKIYELRWSGGKQFASSNNQVKASVQNRLENEKKLAINRLYYT